MKSLPPHCKPSARKAFGRSPRRRTGRAPIRTTIFFSNARTPRTRTTGNWQSQALSPLVPEHPNRYTPEFPDRLLSEKLRRHNIRCFPLELPTPRPCNTARAHAGLLICQLPFPTSPSRRLRIARHKLGQICRYPRHLERPRSVRLFGHTSVSLRASY